MTQLITSGLTSCQPSDSTVDQSGVTHKVRVRRVTGSKDSPGKRKVKFPDTFKKEAAIKEEKK